MPTAMKPGLDLAGGGFGQVRLAAAGRAVHEDAPARGLAVGFVELGVFEGGDDLGVDLLLEGFHAAHVAEVDVGALHLDGGGPVAAVAAHADAAVVIDVLVIAEGQVVFVKLVEGVERSPGPRALR